MKDLIPRAARLNRWHFVLGIFLLCLTVFLSVRASDPYRWSDWGFGDAQTMLSLRQWEEGGWLSNYFLFIPQGYAKVVKLFDDPLLRQHAHGTCPGSSPRVGPRLWYTHYPAGYLVPYAVLFRIGLDSLSSARMLSVFFSVSALVLMYLVFSRITSRGIAFTAVFFYGLTPTFFGYADTLANQPLDDMLRFGFMLAVVLSTRSESESRRKTWMVAAWVMEFLLSLSSFDSVFFIFVWLIGWDFIERRGFRWKRYFIFGLAPVSAHGIQFLQNVWYLGFEDAVIDLKDAFLLKNAANQDYNLGQDRPTVIRDTVGILFGNLYKPGWAVAVVAGLYALYALLLKDEANKWLPSLRLLVVLFLCGLSFILILPHAARMPYEARQMIPFASLLVAGFTWSFVGGFRDALHGTPGSPGGLLLRARKFLAPAYLIVCAVALLLFWYRFALNDRSPVYYIPDDETDARYAQEIESSGRYDLVRFRQLRAEVLLAEELRKIPTAYDRVILSVGGFSLFWDPQYVPGFPQIMPLTEYYTGSSPILCFDAAEAAARDLAYMIRITPERFSPLLVAADGTQAEQVLSALAAQGVLMGSPTRGFEIMGRKVVDLTDFIIWAR